MTQKDKTLNIEAKKFDEDIKKPADKVEEKVPFATQMRIEKAEEEAMYAQRGEVSLKNYYRNLEDIEKVAQEEFNLTFHAYLSLARRRQALEDLRNEKARKIEWQKIQERSEPAPSQTNRLMEKELAEIDKKVNERLKKRLEETQTETAENNRLEQQLRERDREIEQLKNALKEKTPEQKALEKRIHRKARRIHGINHINNIFRFPLLQKAVGKLYELDKTISDFLLDIGDAEFLVTKENIISTAARRLMDVRAIDEPEYYFDEQGNLISKWAYMAKGGSPSKLKKAKKKLFDFTSNG